MSTLAHHIIPSVCCTSAHVTTLRLDLLTAASTTLTVVHAHERVRLVLSTLTTTRVNVYVHKPFCSSQKIDTDTKMLWCMCVCLCVERSKNKTLEKQTQKFCIVCVVKNPSASCALSSSRGPAPFLFSFVSEGPGLLWWSIWVCSVPSDCFRPLCIGSCLACWITPRTSNLALNRKTRTFARKTFRKSDFFKTGSTRTGFVTESREKQVFFLTCVQHATTSQNVFRKCSK